MESPCIPPGNFGIVCSFADDSGAGVGSDVVPGLPHDEGPLQLDLERALRQRAEHARLLPRHHAGDDAGADRAQDGAQCRGKEGTGEAMIAFKGVPSGQKKTVSLLAAASGNKSKNLHTRIQMQPTGAVAKSWKTCTLGFHLRQMPLQEETCILGLFLFRRIHDLATVRSVRETFFGLGTTCSLYLSPWIALLLFSYRPYLEDISKIVGIPPHTHYKRARDLRFRL